MTKEEFKKKFIESGLLTWDKIDDVHFEHMYGHLHFIDSTVAEIFEVPIEMIIEKRKELGTQITKDDYSTFKIYKQQGYLKWDEVNYNRLDYLYNMCNFSDNTIAELFDIPKRTVTTKRKQLEISIFNAFGRDNNRNDVSSYLDFLYIDS